MPQRPNEDVELSDQINAQVPGRLAGSPRFLTVDQNVSQQILNRGPIATVLITGVLLFLSRLASLSTKAATGSPATT